MRFLTYIGAIFLVFHALTVHALSSDRNKPATIEADEVEFDFRTGERTYKGDVVVVQGTLRITGDKMVVQYDQNSEQIQTATTWGQPATFKQRPDGKEDDVYGEGQTIILNEIENTLTLIEDAVMIQAGNKAKGRKIVYDMGTDKMTVKGMRETQGGEEATTDEETGRARVIITPEEQAGAESGEGDEELEGENKEQEDETASDEDADAE